MTKSNLKRGGFYLACISQVAPREAKEGTRSQEIKQRPPWWNTLPAYWLDRHGLLSLSHTIQDHLPKNNPLSSLSTSLPHSPPHSPHTPNHHGANPLTSIIDQENSPQTLPTDQSNGDIFSTEVLSSQNVTCIKLTKT